MRDGFGNGAAEVGFSGLDAALFAAPAKLHQAAIGQTAKRNATRQGRIDDGAGGRPQTQVFVQLAQIVQRLINIETLCVERGQAELLGQAQGQFANLLDRIFDHHLKQTFIRGGRGSAERDRATRLNLQMQANRFQSMRHAEWATAFAGLQTTQAGKQMAQTFFKRLLLGAQIAFQARCATHHGLNSGVACPQIRSAQGAGAGDFHQAFFLATWGFVGAAGWP